MAHTKQTRPLGAAGLGGLSFRSRIDDLQHSSPPPAAQARRVRLQFLAARLHALGPKPLFHFLDEVERGEPLRAHLERYAALPADFIRAHGGDQFPKLFAIREGMFR
jgi:hypothetical protein